jgi:hypothetical protein
LVYKDLLGKELNDTYHESIERAIAQAEFEFGVKPCEWTSAA